MDYQTRIIGDYKVVLSVKIGGYEVVLCENRDAPEDEVYLCGYVENNGLFESIDDCMVSGSYADIVTVFGERVAEKGEKVQKELEDIKRDIGDDRELKKEDCQSITTKDCVKGKVIVLRGRDLRPEYRRMSAQLLFCTGGFGAQGDARGRTCFARRIYDAGQTQCRREDILGIIPEEKLPEWAKGKLDAIRKQLAVRSADVRGDR